MSICNQNDQTNKLKVSCNGEDTGNTVAFCYVDITRAKTADYPSIVYKYGANSKLGKSTIYQLNHLAPNVSLSVTVYLVNEDEQKEAHFHVPTIEFFNYIEVVHFKFGKNNSK